MIILCDMSDSVASSVGTGPSDWYSVVELHFDVVLSVARFLPGQDSLAIAVLSLDRLAKHESAAAIVENAGHLRVALERAVAEVSRRGTWLAPVARCLSSERERLRSCRGLLIHSDGEVWDWPSVAPEFERLLPFPRGDISWLPTPETSEVDTRLRSVSRVDRGGLETWLHRVSRGSRGQSTSTDATVASERIHAAEEVSTFLQSCLKDIPQGRAATAPCTRCGRSMVVDPVNRWVTCSACDKPAAFESPVPSTAVAVLLELTEEGSGARRVLNLHFVLRDDPNREIRGWRVTADADGSWTAYGLGDAKEKLRSYDVLAGDNAKPLVFLDLEVLP